MYEEDKVLQLLNQSSKTLERDRLVTRAQRLLKDNATLLSLLTMAAEQLLAAESMESNVQLALRRGVYDNILARLLSNAHELRIILVKLDYQIGSPEEK